MQPIRHLALLTSGGDAPGMNAAIRAATLVARAAGVEVLGIERGYRGLLDDAFIPLGPPEVGSILREGGTMLGSARCKEFHDRGVRDRARAVLRARGVGGLVVIGGNGSLTGAQALVDPDEAGPEPLRVVGIPASIDNDLGLTGLSIGVDTAMNTIVEACDKIADTATAHDRTFIIEVMGRDCGYLAMTSAIAAGADLALFPEAGRDEASVVDSIVDTVLAVRQRQRRSGSATSKVAVAPTWEARTTPTATWIRSRESAGNTAGAPRPPTAPGWPTPTPVPRTPPWVGHRRTSRLTRARINRCNPSPTCWGAH